jgi:hypothetical protein
LTGHVRSVNVTRRKAVKADIGIDGAGLHTVADVAVSVIGKAMESYDSSMVIAGSKSDSGLPLKGGDRVQIRITQVDAAAEKISAEVIALLD